MNFHIENHGLIKSATIELGNITVICGKNNTGKSYLTYSLYGAMEFLTRKNRFAIPSSNVQELLSSGMTRINLMEVIASYWRPLDDAERLALKNAIPLCMGRKERSTDKITANITIGNERSCIEKNMLYGRYSFPFKMQEGYEITFSKDRDSPYLQCQYVPNQTALNFHEGVKISVPQSAVENVSWVVYAMIYQWLPRPFILGSERTGISVFRDEFNAFRAIAYENDAQFDVAQKLKDRFTFSSYPVAVRKDLEFSMQFAKVVGTKESFLSRRYPLLFKTFEEIVGGSYDVDDKTGLLRFIPRGVDNVMLPISESSSSVRSLCELYFYLKYCARKGDVLIIDEPELNLHPGAQRRLAIFFALLAKLKVRVFITTHSDYIVREINAIVNIGKLEESARIPLMKRYGYENEMLLNENDVRAYVVENGGVTPIAYDEDTRGFGIPSFDDTIEDFNQLYNAIKEASYGIETNID